MIHRSDSLIPQRDLPYVARFFSRFALVLLAVSLAGSWLNAWRGLEVYVLLGAVTVLALLAFALAVVGLAVIWISGGHGAGVAAGALFRSGIALIPTILVIGLTGLMPKLVDVASDPENPIPPPSATINYRDATAPDPSVQQARYGNVADLRFAEDSSDVFAAIETLVERRRWRIIRVDQVTPGQPFYRLEAVARMPILGLHADIAIQVVSEGTGSRVSMRLISRYADHDLGSNAFHLLRLTATLVAMFTDPESLEGLPEETVEERLEPV